MKWVRLEGDIVREIIPHAATVPSIAYWYGEDFAKQCKEAPDNIEQCYLYNSETGEFTPPSSTYMPDISDINELRRLKLDEVGIQCSETIYAGVIVNNASYALKEYDQIEIIAQLDAVKSGAAFVPYHADGELCRMYTAAEFLEIAQVATAHIFYHRTYCNHLNAWIRRAETISELNNITYGVELPNDLASNMAEIIELVNG